MDLFEIFGEYLLLSHYPSKSSEIFTYNQNSAFDWSWYMKRPHKKIAR